MDDFQLLNRLTYGPDSESLKKLGEMGWEKWINWQLNPDDSDPELAKKLEGFRYEMEVGKQGQRKNETFKMDRYPLDTEGLLATVAGQKDPPDHLKQRPAFETFLMTWMRNLYSQWQLKEIMVEFWHNHFNVSIKAHEFIPLVLPVWDREVIRKHVFGNFREFLEATAKSPCMLLYLDNAFSKSGPANENYARELFELHTLGAENYFNHLYDEWREVPGAIEGNAKGYIDEDVYEAARALTGWTIGDGESHEGGVIFPKTGKFHYCDQWHDQYQKRIMGVEFKSHQGPMADGEKVLDLLAFHPGTAHFICKKICTWLVADSPPESLVDAAVNTWIQAKKAPDQIAQVIKTILFSPDFQQVKEDKIKRPNILVSSLIRALDISIKPNAALFYWMDQMGYQYFSYPLPTGHPDQADYWLNTDMMLKRWNMMPIILFAEKKDGGIMNTRLSELYPESIDQVENMINFWSEKILGKKPPEEISLEIEKIFNSEIEGASLAYVRKHHPEGFEMKLRQMVSLLAMAPDFQRR